MRTGTIVLSILFLISPAFAEDADLKWEWPFTVTIDGFDVEHSLDINDPAAWTVVNTSLLPPTATSFTHVGIGIGLHHWRIIAVTASDRTDTQKGAWKRIPIPSPQSASTP